MRASLKRRLMLLITRAKNLFVMIMNKKIKNPVYFGVDDTLVFWKFDLPADLIQVHSAFGLTNLKPNQELIERLKRHYYSAHTIIVWSQSGAEWAETVCKALQIDPYVHWYQDKPLTYYDDTESALWLKRSFVGLNSNQVNNKDIPLQEWNSWKEDANENNK